MSSIFCQYDVSVSTWVNRLMLVDLNRLNIAYDTAFQSSISHQIMSGKKARHTGSDCL